MLLVHPPIWDKKNKFIHEYKTGKKVSVTGKETHAPTAATTNSPTTTAIQIDDVEEEEVIHFDDDLFFDFDGTIQEVELDERIVREQDVEDDTGEEEPPIITEATPIITESVINLPIENSFSDGWHPNRTFSGVPDCDKKFWSVRQDSVPSPSKRRGTTATTQSVYKRLGPQLAPGRTSDPLRAWIQVFKFSVRGIVITHSNSYGFRLFGEKWIHFTDGEFMDVLAI